MATKTKTPKRSTVAEPESTGLPSALALLTGLNDVARSLVPLHATLRSLDLAWRRRRTRLLGHRGLRYQADIRVSAAKNSATALRSATTGHGGSASRNARP